MAILYHLIPAIFLLTDFCKCDELPVNWTTCEQFVVRSITDTAKIDMPIIKTNPSISLSLGNKCNNGYFKLQNNAIVLSGNLTQYCAASIECTFQCLQGVSNTTVVLFLFIIREANYTLKFKNGTYKATAWELTADTAIADLTKELLITECTVFPDQISSVFRIQEQKPYSDWFYIRNAASGIVTATSKVDYEQLNGTHTAHLVIQASQRLPNSMIDWNATTTLDLEILDVDDNNPSFTSGVYHLNITENNSQLDGNPYKTSPPIHAYDGDRGINETIIYSIEDEFKNKFSINNLSGEISVLQELDADGGRDLYVMIIKATQQNNTFRTATSTLSLSVIDIDDNPPIFSPDNYTCNITEHSAVGQVICRVTATDKDKGQYGQFTYELENGNAVDIDPISGYIQVKDSQTLDREKESNLFFQVVAKSSDGNKTDKANVTINLIDINDNSPVFSQSSYNFSVQNISIGDYIGRINAFDLDSGDNQKLNYTRGMCLSNIGRCSGDNMKCHFPFLIDPESGNITLNGCTAGCIYSTLVSVCDSSHYFSRFCSTTVLVIRVEDSSTLPIFNRITSVQENAANNSQVAQFQAKGNTSTSLHCSPVYHDSTTAHVSEETAHNATTAPSVLQRSDVECQTTSLKIFVPKNLVPGNGTVTWRDSACVVHSNGTHFVDTVGLRDCGTTLTLEADYVVFENVLILHKNGTTMQNGNNVVTYGSDYEFAIPVKCVYPRNSNISTSYIPIVQQVRIIERRNGQLDLSMRQYEAEDYSQPVPFNAYPRQVPLNNDIFIRLAMENNVTGLGLSADNCFATSTPSPVDQNWYQLISSGCPVNNAKIHPSGVNDVKFSFHAFNFHHNTSGIVYVHCQVSVCLDTDPACVVGCVTRKKRSASSREGAITSNLISTGPFILTADESGVAMSTVIAAVSIAVAVIATVVAIIGWTRKSKKGADS